MKLKLKQLFDFLISSPTDGQILTYNATSKKWVNSPKPPKMWSGSTTVSSNGQWSINYSAAGFAAAPKVFAQARASGTETQNRNFASVQTVSATSASGLASNSLTSGLLLTYVMNNAPNGTTVDIFAIGT